ncbi:MAG TPA: ankyrin repeat domain-containing protein [Vicinamibacterales bacterium]|jgi:ankyrin repeat protein
MRPASAIRAGLTLAVAVCLTALVTAAPSMTPVADAAMNSEPGQVKTLLEQGADVNTAQHDGMTALHWAALNGDEALAKMLLVAGADANAATRVGGYTPLDIAAKDGHADLVKVLLDGGADARRVDLHGTTPLMLAAASGSVPAVLDLLKAGADVNATEHVKGETALMFAAGSGRTDVIKTLLAHGADWKPASKVLDWTKLPKDDPRLGGAGRRQAAAGAAKKGSKGPAGKAADASADATKTPKFTQPLSYVQLVGTQGGMTALMLAVRQGDLPSVQALVDGGADVNEVNPGDRSSPLLIATINGNFDVAEYLLAHGADPNLASKAGATPLYATINVQWAPKAFYPQPNPFQQQTTYLQMMSDLLKHGANPNARLTERLWYTGYNFDQAAVDAAGSTPFWRAAQSTDLAAMKLLVAHGADPRIWSEVTPERGLPNGGNRNDTLTKAQLLAQQEAREKKLGSPAVSPFLVASGAGWNGNFNVNAPGSWMPTIRYFVEQLHVDVNQRDDNGYTALHYAAARGDNEMILYLVSKGADPTLVADDGMTTVDMANGPKQRINPFPTTIALLEGLGARMMHKCVSCG